MKMFLSATLGLTLALSAITACGGDDGPEDGTAGAEALTAPTGLKAATMDGKPHLTWTDGAGEDHYMIERMDHAVSAEWVAVKDAEELVPGTNQFHDGSAQAGKTYMYRVVAMKGDVRKPSNEVTWP